MSQDIVVFIKDCLLDYSFCWARVVGKTISIDNVLYTPVLRCGCDRPEFLFTKKLRSLKELINEPAKAFVCTDYYNKEWRIKW